MVPHPAPKHVERYFSPTRLALGFLQFGRDIGSGLTDGRFPRRRGTGSPACGEPVPPAPVPSSPNIEPVPQAYEPQFPKPQFFCKKMLWQSWMSAPGFSKKMILAVLDECPSIFKKNALAILVCMYVHVCMYVVSRGFYVVP